MRQVDGDRRKRLSLSRREAQVTLLIALGKTNKEIAAALGLSEQTVKEYVSNALRKLNCERRSELASYAARSIRPVG